MAEPAAASPTRVRWVIFVLACAASWLLYLHRYSWGVIKPFFREQHPEISDVEIGWLDSAFQGSYAFGQLPAGMLGDVFGARLILSATVLAWSVAAVAVAWVAGVWALASIRVVFGLTQAGAYPVLSKMTRTWFPLSIRTSVQGTVTAWGRLGAAASPIIVATFLMGYWELSWQDALSLLLIPGAMLALLLWVFLRNRPREHPWCNAAERSLLDDDDASPVGVPRLTPAAAPLSLAMLCAYSFVSTFQDQLYVYWIPTFLVEGHGMSKTDMGLFTPLPLIGGAIGGILGGLLNDYLIRRTGKRRWSRSGIALAGKTMQGLFVLWCIQAPDGPSAMTILCAARIFGNWGLSTQWGAITDMGGPGAATLFGLVNTFGAIGGFAAGPILGGLKQAYGWEGLLSGVAIMCLLAGLTWLFIDCRQRLVRE
ncbi:MAG: MFS transporter [Gemmataceae bacterium]